MNFSLRPWTISDLDSLVKHANNPNIARNLTDKFPYPYTAENGKAFISFAMQGDPVNIMAIDINGEAVGGIGIHPQSDIQRKNAELGYWLAEPFWGKGIITRAIRQMTDYGFANFDITRIYARPFETNTASKKALEKNSFVIEGRFEKTLYKNGEFLDELIYAIRRKLP
ncbi:MAG: family N-acetyltransferase [Bacteroidetes bacterium]|nr:family N-acetyltransferase [Bacteroidota bacterium]